MDVIKSYLAIACVAGSLCGLSKDRKEFSTHPWSKYKTTLSKKHWAMVKAKRKQASKSRAINRKRK